MEFWGVEVKPGKPLKVQPDEFYLIHLSQASLGESKSSETVPIFVKVGDQKLVLGTLSHEHSPQIPFDLVFDKEFELSHNWKSGSVYFLGYKTPFPDDEGNEELFGGSEDSESEDEELPTAIEENGKVENAKAPKAVSAKAEASVKPKGKVVEPSKDVKSEEDDESDEDEESDTDSEDVDEMSEDEDDESDDSDDEDEETPKKVEVSKKRANESATKTPIPAKKAKAATPQKTDGKKGGHTATPHPAKQAKNNSQSPKSGGQFSCSSCSKKFTSEVGLQSHTKAKHSGK